MAGLTGTVTDVDVTLTNFTHTYPSDVEMLLVGPLGQTVELMRDTGDGTSVSDVTFTLDDEATGPIPDPLSPAPTHRRRATTTPVATRRPLRRNRTAPR